MQRIWRQSANPALGIACSGRDARPALDQLKVKYPSSKSDPRKPLIMNSLLIVFQHGETCSWLFRQVTDSGPSRSPDAMSVVCNRSTLAPKASTIYGNVCRVPEHLVTTCRGRCCSVGPCSGAVARIDVRTVCDQVPVQQIGPVESEKHVLS